jgi:hypothetical protein
MADDISTAELKASYRRGKLWQQGISFDSAISKPVVLRSMQQDALVHRRVERRPAQGNLMFDNGRAR